jgi:Zn-dependent peptidase ImmA (M78 family)
MTKQQVLELAENYTSNGKVDVIQLATKLGIEVYAVVSEDPDYNAKIEYDKHSHTFSIYVNENHPETRRRFSIAHEVSHFVLNKKELKQQGSLDRSDAYQSEQHQQQEQAADQLAAEILMLQNKVEAYVVQHRLTEEGFTAEAIKNLAAYFHVSKAMAVTRLRNMGCSIPYLTFA